MINIKAIKPIKITAKAIDIGVCNTGTYFLDQSSYAWVAGGSSGYSGSGSWDTFSSPVAVVLIKQFVSLSL